MSGETPERRPPCRALTARPAGVRGLLLAAGWSLVAAATAIAQPVTSRVSNGSGGIQANRPSSMPAISADGRWVAFESSASNLVPGDTNERHDVFLHDRQTGTTARVSVSTAGVQGDDTGVGAAVSADGRWVAFESWAGSLVPDDTNLASDIFVHDRVTGATSRVSVGADGEEANERSRAASLSADGRWVVFQSAASNLVADDTNDVVDTFVYDRTMAAMARVSVGPGGVQGNQSSGEPAMSADGRWVAFTSLAGNLVADDTNGVADTFVHDRMTGATTRVSVGPGGVQGNDWSYFWPAISADGRRVAFQSAATNLVAGDTNGHQDVFVHDRQTGTTTLVSFGPGHAQGDSWSEFPAISADGRLVLFNSPSTNLVPGDSNNVADVFVHDLETGVNRRVSQNPAAGDANAGSSLAAVSADGRWAVFASGASDLVADDTNGYLDVFVRDLNGATPLPPAGLVVESIAGSLVTLRWTAAGFGPAPAEFVIEGGAVPGEVLASVPTGSTAPRFTFIAPAGSFYVRAHARSGASRSAASNEIRIHVTVPVVPSAPANLLGLVNGSALALAWTNTYEGGAPASIVLDVAGSIDTSIDLGSIDSFALAGVPAGTYTLALRATNGGGSSARSNTVTLTFPGPSSGPPSIPTSVRAYRVGRTIEVAWAPGTEGPAPTGYVLIVTGSTLGGFATPSRAAAGTVGPGAYTLSVVAANPCGTSPGTSPQQVIVP